MADSPSWKEESWDGMMKDELLPIRDCEAMNCIKGIEVRFNRCMGALFIRGVSSKDLPLRPGLIPHVESSDEKDSVVMIVKTKGTGAIWSSIVRFYTTPFTNHALQTVRRPHTETPSRSQIVIFKG